MFVKMGASALLLSAAEWDIGDQAAVLLEVLIVLLVGILAVIVWLRSDTAWGE